MRAINFLVAVFVAVISRTSSADSALVPTSAVIAPPTNALANDFKIVPQVIASNGYFGSFVAQRSNIVVIGYYGAEDAPTNAPLLDVYQRTAAGLLWQASLPRLVRPTAVFDIATDGERIAVSASEGVLPTVYLYKQIQGEWSIESSLHPTEMVRAISMSKGRIACGANSKVITFELVGSEWRETVITAPSEAPREVINGFGADVALDGDTILVGAPGEIRGDPGRAYVYTLGDSGWLLQAELLPEPYIFTPFGRVVALEANVAMVTAGPTRFDGGFVYWYRRLANAWTRKGVLTGNEGHQDRFGTSLSVSGRNLVVGAPWGYSGIGAVYLFRENGDDLDRMAIYQPEFAGGVDVLRACLGQAVSVEGNLIVAGAPYYSGFATNGGVAAVFNFKFPMTLGSPYVGADNSFLFSMFETEPGKKYLLQGCRALGGEWLPIQEFTAEGATAQVHVDFSATEAAMFYRSQIVEPTP